MINTLSLSRELTKSGLQREHAEAIADVVARAVVQHNGNLATKEFVHTRIVEIQKGTDGKIDTLRVEVGDLRAEVGDLRAEVGELRVAISELRSDMETQIASVRVEISASEARIVRWLVGVAIALGIFEALGDVLPSLISGLG